MMLQYDLPGTCTPGIWAMPFRNSVRPGGYSSGCRIILNAFNALFLSMWLAKETPDLFFASVLFHYHVPYCRRI
jgi:hypothetical protein